MSGLSLEQKVYLRTKLHKRQKGLCSFCKIAINLEETDFDLMPTIDHDPPIRDRPKGMRNRWIKQTSLMHGKCNRFKG